jgi:UDP-N-acetylmuramate--alanine ligase
MPGRHNVLNSLAAIAVAIELGMDDATIVGGFARFEGVKRRFTRVGEVDGTVIIDDYAHHPVEIRAVLSAAREAASALSGTGDGALGGRVIAIVQPHRFTRLRDLMEDFQNAFNEADVVFVAPVYPAGEQPIEGVDAAALAEGLRAHGHRMVRTVADLDDLCGGLRHLAAAGDLVICMGAGDITKWAAALADGVCMARAKK